MFSVLAIVLELYHARKKNFRRVTYEYSITLGIVNEKRS